MPWYEILAGFLKSRGRSMMILDRQTNQPYLERFYILFKDRPKWFPFNIVLHRFWKSDDDGGWHDHPWPAISIILKEGYWEHKPGKNWTNIKKWRKPYSIGFLRPTSLHRVELKCEDECKPVWTLFIMGPRVREWGFMNFTGDTWVRDDVYLNQKNKNSR